MLLAATALLVLPGVVLAIVVVGPWDVSGLALAVDVIRPFFRHPWLILALLGLIGLVFAFQVFAVIDAYRLGRRAGSGRGRAAEWTVVALLLVAILWPYVWAGDRAVALYELVTTDFAAPPADVVALEPMPTTIPSTSAPSQPPPTEASATTAASTTTPPPSTTSPPLTTRPEPLGDRFTVVLLGGDAGPGRTGIRTDTMIVVSIEPSTGRTVLFSIPRNQSHWPIPPGHPAADHWDCGCFPYAVNTIYQYGLGHPELFPGEANAGGAAVKAILGEGLGLEIDYFAIVDLLGFVELVDLFGGIDIYVTKPVYDPGHEHPDGTTTDVRVPVGQHHFDGKMALAYVRVRRQDSDYHRMDRQRCVLEAVAEQVDPVTVLLRFTWLTDIIRENLTTDIPVGLFPDLIDLFQIIDTGSIVSVRFVPGAPELVGTGRSYVAGTDGYGYWKPNLELIRSTVRTALIFEPYDAMVELNLDSLEEACEVP